MKILLFCRYSRLGASSRIRSYQYLPYLESHGIDVTVAPLLGDDYLSDLYAGKRERFVDIIKDYLNRLKHLLNSYHFDLLWVEKEFFPWLPAIVESVLTYFKIPYVVDYDDAIFHRYDRHRNSIIHKILKKKIDNVMRQATLVIVGNDYLAERAKNAGAKRVAYLPSVIDLECYTVKNLPDNDIFTIGWIGSPITVPYMFSIEDALKEVCKDSKTHLIIVGANKISLTGVPIEFRKWSEETEVLDIQDFDVGIMPLPDEPWERGKCGYKIIQYMACGRPVIASPVGVNKNIVEEGVNGFLAKNIDEWIRAFSTLRNDFALRERMGREGRAKVERQYSLQVTAPRLEKLLRSVMRSSSKY